MTPEEILHHYWGYDSFRPLQREIIDSILGGEDTLGLLPTGGGKSLTFQVPAMMLEGLTLVVTPLISLMKDQVDNLAERGIKAVCIHSGLSRREIELALTHCRLGKAKLLYLSPERLQTDRFLSELRALRVSLIVVDEAHCISQWGYDFRPSYLKVAALRSIVGKDVPVLALTASATPEVTADIMERLNFRGRRIFARSFARDNISYVVRHTDNKEQMLLRVMHNTSGCSIVYVRSRRRCRDIALMLEREGVSASYYHAGLDPEEKEQRQNLWKSDGVRVMVATNAFGMGIDKPDVRIVVHYDPPSSLEEYYQEAGRAGRDGKESYAVVISSPSDKGLLTRRLSESFPAKEFISQVYEKACVFLNVAVGSGFGMVYEFDFDEFCRRFSFEPPRTLSALRLLNNAGYIEYVDETTSRSRLMIIMRRDELYDLDLDETTEEVFQYILRNYTGLFADYVYISELKIGRDLMLSTEIVYQSLLTLGRLHAVHYVPRRTTPYLYFPTSREDTRYIAMPHEVYEEQRRRMEQRIDAMKRFMFDDEHCRVSGMLGYFGEKKSCDCGKCDVCRSRRPSDTGRQLRSAREMILHLLSRTPSRSYTIVQLASATGIRPDLLVEAARALADEERIVLEGDRVAGSGNERD